MGNSDNRKRGVNSRQNEKNREALIAVLTVCLIGVLVTVVIIAAVDLYRKHTYTAEIDPSEYKIIKIEKSTTTSYSAATETVDTDSIYVVTVEYQVDGVTYTDTLDLLTGTELAKICLNVIRRIRTRKRCWGSFIIHRRSHPISADMEMTAFL